MAIFHSYVTNYQRVMEYQYGTLAEKGVVFRMPSGNETWLEHIPDFVRWFSHDFPNSIGFCQLSPWSPVLAVWKSSARISRIVSLVSSKNHHHWSNSWLSDKLSIYIYIMTHQHLSQVAQHLYLQGSWWFNVIHSMWFNIHKILLLAVETTNNQPTYLNTRVTLPWASHQLVKMWLCLKGVARCDFFVRCHQIYLRVTLCVNVYITMENHHFSWENSL